MSKSKNSDKFPFLQEQKKLLNGAGPKTFPIAPFKDARFWNSQIDKGDGLQLLKEGAMGCLIAAGGQGTRAKVPMPKGMFPISRIKGKSFFQIFSEKTLAASRLARKPLHLAIMTSPLNGDEIRAFFQENHYFGLDKDQVDFFNQEMLPFLNDEGETFLSAPNHIAEGPNGNGTAIKEFVKSGIWEKWQKKGIRYLNFVMIDNPLADPFDKDLLAFHVKQNAELTLKCIERDDPEEKVGLIVRSNEKVKVVEYSEAPKNIFCDTKSYSLANISLFLINMDAAFDLSHEIMPLHAAIKPAIYFNEASATSAIKLAWKFEYFIFDILEFLKKVEVLVYPKNLCFAPLKSSDDIVKVQAALLESDRRVFKSVSNTEAPSWAFELDQQFYYPTEALKRKWLGQKAPSTSYIDP